MGVRRSLVKLTIGSTFVLGGLALTASLTGGQVVLPVVLATALVNISSGNTANAIDAAIDALTPGKDSDHISLENEHLTKAVGKAIAVVIILAAKPYQGETHSNLMKIAAYAKDNWVKIAQQELTQERYPQLREAKLDQFLTPEEYSLTQDGNLLSEDWEAIFRRLTIATCPEDRIVIDDGVRKEVAKLLHENFPKALRETLKEDFVKDGKAFAGLTLQLLTGTKAELEKLQENQQESFQSVLKHIHELETQLKSTDEQQQAVFTKISQQINSGFAEVCQKLGVMETTITGLLKDLEETIKKMAEQVESVDRKSTEILSNSNRTLSILLELLSNYQVSEIVKDYQNTLIKIYGKLDKIISYKNIHDLLHNLDFYYKAINPHNLDIVTILNNQENHLWKIVLIIDKLETECNSLKDHRQFFWLNTLTEARENISAGHQPKQAKKLSRSISRIKEVLEREPTNINRILKSTISELELLEMSKIIEEICKIYEGDKSQELRIAIDDITCLKQYLNKLIKTHDYWQNIDSEINRFCNEICYSDDLSAIKEKWDDLKELFRGFKAANEHFQENKLKAKLNLLINRFKSVQYLLDQTESNIDNIKVLLNGFCDSCHIYFDSVDHCLLEFCRVKLKPLHRDLENLLFYLNKKVI